MSLTNDQFVFTVFTSTYNRARTLHRVYDSLRSQTFHDFEWLIVDDGSTDGTITLLQEWQRDAPFQVRYMTQDHAGKIAAMHSAVEHARGIFFLTLDSDDECVPNALERLKYHWDSIPESQRENFSAVTVLCMDQRGNLVGTPFPYSPTDSNSLEIRYRYKVSGEKWGFQKTEILRNPAFAVANPEYGYLPPGLIWSKIARHYKTRYVNEKLRIYWRAAGEQRLSNSSDFALIAPGSALAAQTTLNTDLDWFRWAPRDFLATALQYSRFSFHSQRSIGKQWFHLDTGTARALWLCTVPVGYGVYQLDRYNLTKRIKQFCTWSH